MGLFKKEGDLHYYPSGDKHVCSECFSEEHLKGFIESQGEPGRCDFCGNESSEYVLDFDDVLEYIRDRIYTEWGDPNDELVPFEDGEYIFPIKDSENCFVT